jgi:retron-type reverse transcriptase
LDELENGSASLHKNIKEKKLNPNWFRNDKNLFKRVVLLEALKRAWYMIKSKPGMFNKSTDDITLNKLSESWFVATNKKLFEGLFKYLIRRRVFLDKPSDGKKPLIIANPRIKIIERVLLNALEPIFEGYYHCRV